MSAQEQQNWYCPALPQDLKPRQGSFVFPRIIGAVVASGVIGAVTAGVLASLEKSPWPGLAVFTAGTSKPESGWRPPATPCAPAPSGIPMNF